MNDACALDRRRDAVAAHATLNGIDVLEVIDGQIGATDPLRQRTLLVHCLKPLPPAISAVNVRVGSGTSTIGVEWAAPADPVPRPLNAASEAGVRAVVAGLSEPAAVLVVRVARPGDFSTHRLRFVASRGDEAPLPTFDPQLAAIDFSFKVECPSELDCLPPRAIPTALPAAPDINYLARDYATFRRLLLDRIAQLAPEWKPRSPVDHGVALLELLAYVGDHLSYQQDAIATEAYLETARRRTSLRRHAVLVDYPMHEGSNARAWLQLMVTDPKVTLGEHAFFLTRCGGAPAALEEGSEDAAAALERRPLVFEPLHLPTFHKAHNEILLYTWGDTRREIAKGATRATLIGRPADLASGDALLFEEVLGRTSGETADADRDRRHVVRLTAVLPDIDPVTDTPITIVTWAARDALPFALCLSTITDVAHGSRLVGNVSVARGNLLLVDHGATVVERLDAVDGIAPRYRPTLRQRPLTHAPVLPIGSDPGGRDRPRLDPTAPAADALHGSIANALPQITLVGTRDSQTTAWVPVRTLLSSAPEANDFVVEVDEDGRATLRFGDGLHGARPVDGTTFEATYRVGNGTVGNVGAGSIAHVVRGDDAVGGIASVRQPMPATGGVDPESAESVRRNAPEAFRTQERAVAIADYIALAEAHREVRRAAGALRWTGAWHTAVITIDVARDADSGAVKARVLETLQRARMTGHDVDVRDPKLVPIELALRVVVEPEYSRSDVRRQLMDVFSDRRLPDGRLGFFYPDNLTFGKGIFLSQIYRAAHDVPGVAAVVAVTFQRQGVNEGRFLVSGQMILDSLEIAELANDPTRPEHGVLRLELSGGR